MIYLVRQGETDWNLNRKFNGCTDTKLNHTGIAQAKQQAEKLRNVNFKTCFCSPQTYDFSKSVIKNGGLLTFENQS